MQMVRCDECVINEKWQEKVDRYSVVDAVPESFPHSGTALFKRRLRPNITTCYIKCIISAIFTINGILTTLSSVEIITVSTA